MLKEFVTLHSSEEERATNAEIIEPFFTNCEAEVGLAATRGHLADGV